MDKDKKLKDISYLDFLDLMASLKKYIASTRKQTPAIIFGIIASIGVISAIIFGYLNFKITIENNRLNKDLVEKYKEVESLRRELDTISITFRQAQIQLDSAMTCTRELRKYKIMIEE